MDALKNAGLSLLCAIAQTDYRSTLFPRTPHRSGEITDSRGFSQNEALAVCIHAGSVVKVTHDTTSVKSHSWVLILCGNDNYQFFVFIFIILSILLHCHHQQQPCASQAA